MALKTLTHERMELFLRCRRKFRKTIGRHKGEVSTATQVAKVVGKTVEQATAISNPAERQSIVEAAMLLLPEGEQADALRRVETCVSRSDDIRSDEQHSQVRKQHQFRWFDEVTGWTLMAKPDFVRFTTDARGVVIQVIDEKISGHVTSYQKRFLHFLGLVVAKQLDEERKEAFAKAKELDVEPVYTVGNGFLAELFEQFGAKVLYGNTSIELVIRLLGDNDDSDGEREVSIGFHKRSRQWEQLAEIRRVIEGIEAAFEADDFPARVDWNCDRCPFKLDCPAYKEPEAPNADEALAETA